MIVNRYILWAPPPDILTERLHHLHFRTLCSGCCADSDRCSPHLYFGGGWNNGRIKVEQLNWAEMEKLKAACTQGRRQRINSCSLEMVLLLSAKKAENTEIRIYQLLYLSSKWLLLIHGLNFKMSPCHRLRKQLTVRTEQLSWELCHFLTCIDCIVPVLLCFLPLTKSFGSNKINYIFRFNTPLLSKFCKKAFYKSCFF